MSDLSYVHRFRLPPAKPIPQPEPGEYATLLCGRAVSPSHAANSRRDLNRLGSGTVAAMAVAVIMLTPGIVAKCRLISQARCQSRIGCFRASISA